MQVRFLVSSAAALIALALVVGCGKSPGASAEQLPGAWEGTVTVNEEGVKGKLGPAELAKLRSMKMQLEFQADGRLVLKGDDNNGKPYTSEARWETVSSDGNTLTIRSLEGGTEEKMIDIRFEGKDAFSMPLKTERADIGAMKFKRLR